MVLSAGGISLVWLLLGTLWLPALDYASSYRGLGRALATALHANGQPNGVRLQASGLNPSQLGLIAYWSGASFAPAQPSSGPSLQLRLTRAHHGHRALPAPLAPGQSLLWSGGRPGEGDERYELIQQR